MTVTTTFLTAAHGSAFDRGRADSYYRRSRRPHYWPEGTGHGLDVTDLTEQELAEYHAGYDENEAMGDFKDYGYYPGQDY